MKKAGDLLKDFFDNLKLNGIDEKPIASFWEDIVGKEIAQHTRVKEIKKGILIIEADHPGWLQIINLKKRQIIDKVIKEFPEKEITEMKSILIEKNDDR